MVAQSLRRRDDIGWRRRWSAKQGVYLMFVVDTVLAESDCTKLRPSPGADDLMPRPMPHQIRRQMPSPMPRRRMDIPCHEIDGEAVLYDVAHHAVHYLNTTAFFVFTLCDGSRTIENMATELAGRHRLDLGDDTLRAQVLGDVRRTVTELIESGLVEPGCEASS